jgi:ubiquinone biosynthesis protein COQ9
MDETEERTRKDALVAALLPDVPFDGWSREAMRAAARGIEIDEAELAALFPGGPRDAVAWFSRWADRLTLETVASRPIDGLKLGERIALGVRTRLELLAPHREAVRQALSLLALPTNAPLGLRLLYETVDALWYAAGDTATDFSFYTKRATLAGIYAATTLYWLDDRSDGGAATDAFLQRRLEHLAGVARLGGRLERAMVGLPNPFRLLRAARPRF